MKISIKSSNQTISEMYNNSIKRNMGIKRNSMGMNLNEFKFLTNTCWNEKYQPLTFDMTRDKYTDRYRLG